MVNFTAGKKPVLTRSYSESDEGKLRYLRLIGLFVSFCSLGFSAVAIGNRRWVVWLETGKGNGIWDNCHHFSFIENLTTISLSVASSSSSSSSSPSSFPSTSAGNSLNVLSNKNGGLRDGSDVITKIIHNHHHHDNVFNFDLVNKTEACTKLSNCNWVVIVLLLLSLAFGLLATTLATVGVCVTSLAWKLYYFHSAAEVYFVCGLMTSFSAVIRSICLELNQDQLRRRSHLARLQKIERMVDEKFAKEQPNLNSEVYSANFSEKFTSQLKKTEPHVDWPQNYSLGSGFFVILMAGLFYFIAAATMCADDLALVIKRKFFGAKRGSGYGGSAARGGNRGSGAGGRRYGISFEGRVQDVVGVGAGGNVPMVDL